MLSWALVFPLLALQAAADLTCRDFVPKNWTSSTAKIYVFSGTEPGSIFDRPGVLPTYASVGNPWKLRYKANPGAKFSLTTCNSTSLGLSASTQSSCSHGGCYISYTDYVQIINPYTDHCLATQFWNVSATNLDFVSCDPDAANTGQLWSVNQYVNYAPNLAYITSYGPVTLDPIQRGSPESLTPPFFAWYINTSDNKTLEVDHYDYTQHGVFMDLKQV